jgi:hypothetical protein
MFDQLLSHFLNKDILAKVVDKENVFHRAITPESDAVEHDKICLLASVLYPTLDCKLAISIMHGYENKTDRILYSLLDHYLLFVSSGRPTIHSTQACAYPYPMDCHTSYKRQTYLLS